MHINTHTHVEGHSSNIANQNSSKTGLIQGADLGKTEKNSAALKIFISTVAPIT